MPLKLAPCTDGDMDRAFAIISDAFGQEHPYINYVFPKHDTSAGRKIGAERLRAIKNADPNTTYLKITDSDTGTITAVAKWNIYDGIIPEEVTVEGDFWDTESEKKLAQEIFAGYLLPRRQAIRNAGGRIVCAFFRHLVIAMLMRTPQSGLDMMVVDPEYQRTGAGRMLARWGTEIADRMGVKVEVDLE
ncbi:hypothetical protein MMC28_006429 [Mycoblastus sanguinarius]|nr:hypothetical protein [Mycoblastus sanguinarius]